MIRLRLAEAVVEALKAGVAAGDAATSLLANRYCPVPPCRLQI